MDKGSSDININEFRGYWEEEARKPDFSPQYRLNLRDEIKRLLDRITNKWYDSEEVVEFSEELSTNLSKNLTDNLESVTSENIEELQSDLPFENSQSNDLAVMSGEVKSILKEHIDEEGLEQAFSNTDFDWNIIKSSLYQEVSEIDTRETKRAFNMLDRTEFLKACISELESDSLKEDYRTKLVSIVRDYLNNQRDIKDIGDIIEELVGELHSTGWDEDSIQDVIEVLTSQKDIGLFCKTLLEEVEKKTYCIPLPADNIPRDHVKIAGVDFYMEECEQFEFLTDLVAEDERVEPLIDRFGDDTKLFAVVPVVAPNSERGERRMEKKVERAIDALNFNRERGVIRSPFMQPRTEYIVRNSDGYYRKKVDNHAKYGFPYSWNNDEDMFESRLDWFNFLDSSSGQLTELEQRFVRSYRWYGDAIQSGIPEEELLKYIISMENMLVPEPYEKKKEFLAMRMANLRGIYLKYRQGYKDGIVELYDTRNELVHSAEIDITGIERDVKTAHRMSSRMFAIIAETELDTFKHTDEFLEDLEEREIPKEPEDKNPFRVG